MRIGTGAASLARGTDQPARVSAVSARLRWRESVVNQPAFARRRRDRQRPMEHVAMSLVTAPTDAPTMRGSTAGSVAESAERAADCGCGIGYEAGFGAGFGAGCGSRSRSAVVARQLQRRGRAGSGTATSAAREGAATGATLAAVRRARRSLGRGPTRAEAPADDEKARGRGPRGRVGCCRARDRGLRARTAGTAWGGALRTSHSHRGTIRAHSGHYRIAARRGQHTVRGRRTSCRQQQNALFCVWPYFLQPGVWPTRSQRMYSGRFHELVTWHKSVPASTVGTSPSIDKKKREAAQKI